MGDVILQIGTEVGRQQCFDFKCYVFSEDLLELYGFY